MVWNHSFRITACNDNKEGYAHLMDTFEDDLKYFYATSAEIFFTKDGLGGKETCYRHYLCY